jgi:hypothetical protein
VVLKIVNEWWIWSTCISRRHYFPSHFMFCWTAKGSWYISTLLGWWLIHVDIIGWAMFIVCSHTTSACPLWCVFVPRRYKLFDVLAATGTSQCVHDQSIQTRSCEYLVLHLSICTSVYTNWCMWRRSYSILCLMAKEVVRCAKGACWSPSCVSMLMWCLMA